MNRHAKVREWLHRQFDEEIIASDPGFEWPGSEVGDESLSSVERGIRKWDTEWLVTERLADRVPGFRQRYLEQDGCSFPSSTDSSELPEGGTVEGSSDPPYRESLTERMRKLWEKEGRPGKPPGYWEEGGEFEEADMSVSEIDRLENEYGLTIRGAGAL